jgi:signal peptide peptidase SppA, 36K type
MDEPFIQNGEREAPAPEESATPLPPAEAAPAAGVPPGKPRRGSFFWGLLSGCLLVFVLVIVAGMVAAVWSSNDERSFAIGSKVAVVLLEGEIVDSRELIEQLHRYARNSSVKAIVIRINSPGGGIAPSQEIFEEIRRVRRENHKPVVASMDSVAASGGYYVAVACDRIVANPGTITGSIGVIFQWFNIGDLLQWARLKPETITSGAMKDAGSPYRPISEAEKAYFQNVVAQLHSQFVRAVAEGRKGKISEEEVRKLADGRIFTGEEAQRLKLIDELGNLDDAVSLAASLGGIKGKPSTIYPKKQKPGLLELLGGSDAETLMKRLASGQMRQFLYKW